MALCHTSTMMKLVHRATVEMTKVIKKVMMAAKTRATEQETTQGYILNSVRKVI